jgi:hypothetical protein
LAERRWPSYVLFEATLVLPDKDYTPDFALDICQCLRGIVGWYLMKEAPLSAVPDQRVTTPGYRWGYVSPGRGDFVGNPTPTPFGSYCYADPGEGVGPGFVVLENRHFMPPVPPPAPPTPGDPKSVMEWVGAVQAQTGMSLVWSQAIPLADRKTAADDEVRIEQLVQRIRTYWNSHDEIRDAEGHLARGDIKASVRSTAASLDAAARFFSREWGVAFGGGNQPFNGKLDQMLSAAGHPTYSGVDPAGWEAIGRLYRARNSQHEGDVYYKDDATHRMVRVDAPMMQIFLMEATEFLAWIDSLA